MEKSHEKILGLVQNGHGGNAKDDGEHKCGGREKKYGGVGGVKKNNLSFLDSGAPVGKTKQTTKGGVADIKNDIGGYSIVQAESHDAAATLFANSPHLTMPGATVEVMEIMPMPGM